MLTMQRGSTDPAERLAREGLPCLYASRRRRYIARSEARSSLSCFRRHGRWRHQGRGTHSPQDCQGPCPARRWRRAHGRS